MSGLRKAFLLRINSELLGELEAWAQEDFRSVNGQIEFLLREALRRRRRNEAAMSEASAQPVTEPETAATPPLLSPDSDLEMGRHD
jgi:hypothetical protein